MYVVLLRLFLKLLMWDSVLNYWQVIYSESVKYFNVFIDLQSLFCDLINMLVQTQLLVIGTKGDNI